MQREQRQNDRGKGKRGKRKREEKREEGKTRRKLNVNKKQEDVRPQQGHQS
jgi:hypothetical protein